ncbi:hypothetical protein M0804_008623 [Polistes exclamans]|nr:hypothetical protein M0804_008623 [Polistes exclamans]
MQHQNHKCVCFALNIVLRALGECCVITLNKRIEMILNPIRMTVYSDRIIRIGDLKKDEEEKEEEVVVVVVVAVEEEKKENKSFQREVYSI